MSRFNAQPNARGGSPIDLSAGGSPDDRGGQGADGQTPHSSSGFRRALMKSARGSNRLKDQLPNKTTFAGKGFKKPNYFAQGAKRHGMHMGAGAPVTQGAGDTGADFGGN